MSLRMNANKKSTGILAGKAGAELFGDARLAAFLHGDWRKIYDYALAHDFRFLSYGDSSLLIP